MPQTPASLRVLLSGLVDYAALCPPAGLSMRAAVEDFAAQRSGDAAWMLGRFVVPVSRLGEFEAERSRLRPRSADDEWRVSALVGDDRAHDIERVEEFNTRRAPRRAASGTPVIEAMEATVVSSEDIASVMRLVPRGVYMYLEIPCTDDAEPLLTRVAASGARAQVRTGGVLASDFPSAKALARFLAACTTLSIPFKATAGLHHPLCGVYRLTYDAGSASTRMFGFVNLFVAAAALRAGVPEGAVVEILEESSPAAFRFEDGALVWRETHVALEVIAETRAHLALTFASCSLQEPLDDLHTLGWLRGV